jgi:hypothetical protein
VTGWAIARVIPYRFDGAQAEGLDAGFELRVSERRGREPLRFWLQIRDGSCRVQRGPARAAGAVAIVGLPDLIRLTLGLASWPQLMSSRRLELTGDPFLALRFPLLFRLPSQARFSRRKTA